jgi:Arc/MetJ-type ribon-helix-helix transcriptional regulator
MRATKVYSISMPPDLARQAERLAKKENWTMSELVRQALRCYQSSPPAPSNMRDYIRHLAPTPAALLSIREEAKRKGSDKLSMHQIDREVNAVRRQRKQRAAQ